MSKHTPGPWFVDANGKVWRRDPRDLYENGGGVAGDHPIATAHRGWSRWDNVFPVEANARLIAATPDLLECLTMGAELNTPDILDWVADRLVSVHGESPFVDFVVSIRNRANAMRKAIAKATGE